MNGREMAAELRSLAEETSEQIAQTESGLVSLQADREAALLAQRAAAIEAGAVFLPALSAEHLQSAEQRTGFRGFSRLDPIKAMAKERDRLERDLATLRADDRYVRRAFLVGEHGDLTRRLAEARDMLATWEDDAARFESLEGFNELIELGYDTPAYAVRWWETRYWRLWAAGDAACDALGLADFGDDVLPAYHKVREPRDGWRARVRTVIAEIEALHDLVRRHDEQQDRLSRLEEIYLEESRLALGRHLLDADPALLQSWNEDDRAMQIALRRLTGCGARVRYLSEMIDGLTAQRDRLRGEHAKLMAKAAKMELPKRAYSQQPPSSTLVTGRSRLGKVHAARSRLLDDASRMRTYDRYDRFNVIENDPCLWYMELTGRRPTGLLANTRDWYDRNPDACVVRTGGPDPSDALNAALGGADAGFGDVS